MMHFCTRFLLNVSYVFAVIFPDVWFLQIYIQEYCGAAFWIPTLQWKKNKLSFMNTTSTTHRLSNLTSSLLTTYQTNSHVCPHVDTHWPHQLAHTPTEDTGQTDSLHAGLKSIAKLLAICHLMVTLKKRTTSPSPAGRRLEQRDESFFSALAASIELLEQLAHKWRMYANCNPVSYYSDIIFLMILFL